MTAEQTYCATCGELIIRISDRWMHIEMPERIHPATPRVTAGETYQALRAELARVNAENAAMRAALAMHNQEAPETDPVRPAIERLRGAWDQLCRCIDEFGPESDGCNEHRDLLDVAILAVLRVAGDGRAVDDQQSPAPGEVHRSAGPGVTFSFMRPEHREALADAMAGWEEHLADRDRLGLAPKDPVYAFAYWLLRYSGLVEPTKGGDQ